MMDDSLKKLISTLLELKDLGNTVIVVEHDQTTMEAADWIIDLGPGAGIQGGKVVYEGKYKNILNKKGSLTGAYLSKNKLISTPKTRRIGNKKHLISSFHPELNDDLSILKYFIKMINE